ncbi:psbP domain-containing protein 3, chloroplastic isoform X2 [Dendrobium catenatum]|uniref:psbP domain-containing protein 3, chloroplastic isoform X2 n=1 Tax=Dendrobium catenatum TaxID=906689 RepID=UPI0009F47E96|nr:psbP domain-containing protein 3, chloroplastic isoform X2 [Dendrobium catenatum]
MAYFSPHRLLPLTSKAPKCPKPKIPEVSLSFFTSAFIPCDPRHSNPNPTSLGESSLHHFYMNAKASNLVSRSGFMRRDVLLGTLLGATSFPFVAFGSLAESDLLGSFQAYEDENNKFRIFVPEGWSVGAGETNRIKSVTAFYPKEVSNSNVSVTIVGVGPDFTGLGSFGKVDAFAETLVNGLDRSWQRPPGVAAKLINSAAANGLYYIEYTLQNPGERLRHIFSAIGIASNGWYNRLYTVTGQVQLFYPTQLDSFDHDQSLGSFLHGF